MALSTIGANQIASLPTGSVDTAQLASNAVTDAKLASGAITSAAMPTGSVIQVVQSTSTTQYNIAAADTFEDTGYSVTITPNSSSNKILITFSAFGILLNPSHIGVQLLRGSTVVALNEGYATNSSHWTTPNYGFSYLDSPSTPSATPYKIQARADTRTSNAEMRFLYQHSNIPGDPNMSLIAQEIVG